MAVNREDDVERALAALRDAKVPEGMEERIAARLAAVAGARNAGFRWREVFSGSAAAGVWWRGALSGVAMAAVVMGLVWLGGRSHRVSGDVVVKERVVAAVPQGVAVKKEIRSEPCVSAPPRVVRESAADSDRARRMEFVGMARAAMEASHPAPAMGLTAQERQLVQLARTGDAKDLAALDPETRARAEARDAAEFQKFFAEPVRAEAPPAAVPPEDNQ